MDKEVKLNRIKAVVLDHLERYWQEWQMPIRVNALLSGHHSKLTKLGLDVPAFIGLLEEESKIKVGITPRSSVKFAVPHLVFTEMGQEKFQNILISADR